jgi:hypothetical protein
LFKQMYQSVIAAAVLILPCAASVNVSSPANNATVGSPVHVVASATSSHPVTAMAVYVDNNLATKVGGSSLVKDIAMGAGKHFVVVQAWDSAGAVQKTPLTVNVSGTTSGGGTSATGGTTIWNIDQMGGWANCGACAGPGGNGPVVPYSMTQFRSSPSEDGKSVQFWIGSGKSFGAALWWKQLGAQPNATYFTYDLDFYLDNPGAAQALEFDMNQSVNGRKYIFGTECNILGSHQWDVWDTAGHRWVPTGVGCSQPTAYQWHHVTIEAQRVGAQVKFVAITLDGKKNYINRYYNTYATNAQELNVAVQLDGNRNATSYSMWVDKITLNYK